MSIQEAPAPEVAGIGTPGTADGSLPDGAEPAQETDEQATDEGAEPESGTSGNGKSPSAETARLKEQYEAMAAENARYADLLAQIDASPYGQKLYQHLNGQPTEGAEDDAATAYVSRYWPRTVRNADGDEIENRNHEVMVGLVKTIREDITRQLEAKLAPQLQGVQRTINGSKFERALSDRGLDASVQKSPEFRAFAKQMEHDPESGSAFRKLREAKPVAAANWLAAEFNARNGVRASNAAARERVDMSRGAKLNGSSPRGGATAGRQFVYDPRDPSNADSLRKFFEAGGKRENVVLKRK